MLHASCPPEAQVRSRFVLGKPFIVTAKMSSDTKVTRVFILKSINPTKVSIRCICETIFLCF